jgi:creatinine amidohydrolase
MPSHSIKDQQRATPQFTNATHAPAITHSKRSPLFLFALALLALSPLPAFAQIPLPVKWEELTAGDFVKAIRQSQGTCILPIGILEKHGQHLPLGTDLLNIRYISNAAAQQEYAVIFPEYYFGQIFEARHQPGTIAYSAHMQLELLQETTDEMARNGCKKILIANGHGGNESLLPYFAQTQLAVEHDYVVYVFPLPEHLDQPGRPALKTPEDMHAGETETAHVMISRPDLVHLDRAASESGADQKRLNLPDTLYTGIWWYARFPNHYAGDGSKATKELGEFDMKEWTAELVTAIRAVKADAESLKLQNEFFERAKHPLDTK